MQKKPIIEISDSLEELMGNSATSAIEKMKTTELKKKKKKKQGIGENKFSQENLAQLSQHMQLSNENDIIYIGSPRKVEHVHITGKAFDKIILMAQAVNEVSKDRWGPDSAKLEVYCYVLGEKPSTSKTDSQASVPDSPQLITDIYIPYHTASETNVTVAEEGIIEVREYIEKNNKVVLGWAHSHGHYEVYSSQTDEINHLTLLFDTANYISSHDFRLKYIYGITVNDKSERFGVILTQFPCNHVQRAEDTSFNIIGDTYSKDEFLTQYQEIKAIVTDRVKIKEPGASMTQQDQVDSINDELLSNFVSKLHRAKNLLIDDLPEELDDSFDKIQTVLHSYDQLILDSIEESFKQSSKDLLRTLKKLKDSR
ncbi:MAG: hypothetical protein ACTSYI_09485 [Promethearchaeota archaeon]